MQCGLNGFTVKVQIAMTNHKSFKSGSHIKVFSLSQNQRSRCRVGLTYDIRIRYTASHPVMPPIDSNHQISFVSEIATCLIHTNRKPFQGSVQDVRPSACHKATIMRRYLLPNTRFHEWSPLIHGFVEITVALTATL